MQFLKIFMQYRALSAFILCNFHVFKMEDAYIKDLNAWRILMNFLCIYLGEGRGGALMHVYVWEHIVSLYYRTAKGGSSVVRLMVKLAQLIF